MKLEDQVCSLELSKKLFNLGIKQISTFYWYEGYDSWLLHYIDYNHSEEDSNVFIKHNSPCYSAFNASELGELLPNIVTIPDNEPFNNFRIKIEKFYTLEKNIMINNYRICYECDTYEVGSIRPFMPRSLSKAVYDPNLSNAMAKMLIYLIENDLIKSEDVT